MDLLSQVKFWCAVESHIFTCLLKNKNKQYIGHLLNLEIHNKYYYSFVISRVIKNVLNLLWELIHDKISNSLQIFTIPAILGISSSAIFKNVDISLLENKNWRFEDHLSKIPLMCWQMETSKF